LELRRVTIRAVAAAGAETVDELTLVCEVLGRISEAGISIRVLSLLRVVLFSWSLVP
jgi:hypothetical protein